MKKSPKKILIITALALLLTWLLFPRFNSDWNIEEDDEMMEGKKEYLKNRIGGIKKNSPNILIILADDLGRNDLALYDQVHGVKTPNIEALAAEGVTFNNALSSSPICSPSRAGLLTGRVQNRSGFDSQPMQIYPAFPLYYYFAQWFLDFDEMSQVPFGTYPTPAQMAKQGIPQSEILMSEILSQAGYDTSLIGKWHLGYNEEQHPLTRGFDHFYGFLEAFSYFDDPSKEDVKSYQHDVFWEKHIWSKKRKGPSSIQINGQVIEEDRHLTDAFAEETLNYINGHEDSGTGKPFFVYASFSAPHTPFQELKEYYDRFPDIDDENRRIYCAMISHLDDAVGDLMEGLEELGIRDETLIFFSSDNGSASYTKATGNGDLAGGKMSQFQGGLEVPLIISYPQLIPRNSVYEETVSLMDIYSTALVAADIPLSEDRLYDGVNLIPYINGKVITEPHESLFWISGFNHSLLRGAWKIMKNTDTGETQLYNLEKDRGEFFDVSKEFPEILKKMETELFEKSEECNPPLWPRVMDFEIEVHGKKYKFAI